MRLVFEKHNLHVYREDGDPKYYGVLNAAGESRLLYAIKNQLNAAGYDLIKKRMHKDGHLVSEMQQYLRVRKPSGDPEKDICIWNGYWQIRGIEEDFNDGHTVLIVERGIFSEVQ